MFWIPNVTIFKDILAVQSPSSKIYCIEADLLASEVISVQRRACHHVSTSVGQHRRAVPRCVASAYAAHASSCTAQSHWLDQQAVCDYYTFSHGVCFGSDCVQQGEDCRSLHCWRHVSKCLDMPRMGRLYLRCENSYTAILVVFIAANGNG